MTCSPIVERELRVAARKTGPRKFRVRGALVLMLIWLILIIGSRTSTSPAELGRNLFATLAGVTLAVCLLAGAFLTADCLSEEKREGTLGLLFLTDLKGYDVVLGKLAATSLNSFYGLLAIFPILALPMLLGGVSGAEFGRVMLALLVTLLFSLASGLAVSALSRESRAAAAGTLGLVLLLALIVPVLYGILAAVCKIRHAEPLVWLSPISAYSFAFDSYYHLRHGPRDFWSALGVASGVSSILLFVAVQVLPRAWQEKKLAAAATGKRGIFERIRFGNVRARIFLRAKLLPAKPFYWLATRDRLPRILVWSFFGVMIPVWLCFLVGTFFSSFVIKNASFQFFVLTTIAFHIVFKCFVALEAARRLSDDRQSGALEAILVTPLLEKEIFAGQRRALLRHFWAPLFFLAAANLCVLERIWSLPGIGADESGVFSLICFGGILVLLFDFYALGWLGMWRAMYARRYYRAVLGALMRVMVVPWLILLLVGFLVAGGRGGFSTEAAIGFFVTWFTICVVNDLIVGIGAKMRLRAKFRRYAAGIAASDPPLADGEVRTTFSAGT